ncbi:MAG: hypothetical protein ACT4OI_00230 [Methanobacteriota archaeon]
MEHGMKWGLRATVLVVVVLAVGAVGILTPIVSNTVEKDVRVEGYAITLSVDGVPASVVPGDTFRVVATMANNANRPIPAVLRMEVRNPNSTTPGELTVYAGCGAEEVVSSRTLLYYIGWHGPLLAPKGSAFPAGTSVAALEQALGSADFWGMTLHEIEERDPAGYASLISPGTNASEAVRSSPSVVLRTLYYYDMVRAPAGSGGNLLDWALTMPFADTFVAGGDGSQDGFLIEIHAQSRGTFEFKFWAERPDGLGVPGHPYTCGPL